MDEPARALQRLDQVEDAVRRQRRILPRSVVQGSNVTAWPRARSASRMAAAWSRTSRSSAGASAATAWWTIVIFIRLCIMRVDRRYM